MAYQANSASFLGKSESPGRASMGAPLLDWMLFLHRQVWSFQKQALRLYGLDGSTSRTSDRASAAPQRARDVEVIPLGRETLNVGTRVVSQGTTRVRRFVIETPVEEKVPLRQERVIVERRRPIAVSSTGDTLTDKTIEMSDTVEVPVVWTSVELAEEVVVRREVKERVESVRGVVRHDEVEIQEIGQASRGLTELRTDAHRTDKQAVAKLDAASPDKGRAREPVEATPVATGQEQKPPQDAKAASASSNEPGRHAKH